MLDSNLLMELKNKLLLSEKIAIFSHENIDGDSLWAGLALGSILEKQGKKVSYFTPDEISPKFSFLEDVKKYSYNFDFGEYDILVFVDIGCVDTQLKKFWSQNSSYWKNKYKIAIDHHLWNCKYADLNIIYPNYSSTCALLYDILENIWLDLIDQKISTFLFLWHITDTNFCKWSNDSKDMKIAAQLFEKWADKKAIIDNIYYNMTFEGVKFLGKLIDRIKIKNNIVYARYMENELQQNWLDSQDVWLLMDIMLKIKQKEVYIILKFLNNGLVKWSIRTKTPIANKIASALGWGWHSQAAGFKLEYDSQQVNKFVEELIEKVYKIYSNVKYENT